MTSRLETLKASISQLNARIPADAAQKLTTAQTTTDAARVRADQVRYHNWVAFSGNKMFSSMANDREALQHAERALTDINEALDQRYAGVDAKMQRMGVRLGGLMGARDILSTVFRLGNVSPTEQEVVANLKTKLHLTDKEAGQLAGVLRDVSRVGFDGDSAKFDAEQAEAAAGIRARAAVFAQSADRLARAERVSGEQYAELAKLAKDVEGTTMISDVMSDSFGNEKPGERKKIYSDFVLEQDTEAQAIVAGVASILKQVRELAKEQRGD